MPEISAFSRPASRRAPVNLGCGTLATPEVRRRLLALAVAALAPVGLADTADAQQTASGTVRLIVSADVLAPDQLEADDSALLWMSPEAALATERLAAQWASGAEEEAVRSWKSVVKKEAQARGAASDEQLAAAAGWIAARVAAIASTGERDTGDPLSRLRLMAIRSSAQAAALQSIEELPK
jgi:hypothetical protein